MSQLNNMQRPDSQHRPLVAYMTLAPAGANGRVEREHLRVYS